MSPDPNQDDSFYTDCLCCSNCCEILLDSKKLPCGLLLCDECKLLSSRKRFKCSTCNSYHSILSNHLLKNINQTNRLNNQINSTIIEIENKLNILKSTLINGDDIIKEHCIELRRQVQLSKEQKIQHIENTAFQMIKKINDYENKSLDIYYSENSKQFKSKIDEIQSQLNQWNEKLNQLKTTQNNEKDLENLQKLNVDIESSNQLRKTKMADLVFKNNHILTFFNTTKSESNVLGCLKEKSSNNINYENLVKIDFGKYFYKFNLFALKENRKNFQFNVLDTKLLPNNDLIVLVEYITYDNYQESLYLIKIDLDGKWKRHINLKTLIDLNFVDIEIDLRIFIGNNLMCLNYHSNSGDVIKVFDFDLNIKKELNLLTVNKKVIGVNDHKIFMLTQELNETNVIEIYNWNLYYEDSFGQSTNQSRPFYVPKHCKQVFTCEDHEKKRYLVVQSRNEIRIINLKSGNARVIRECNVIKCDFDLDKNLVMFRKEKLAFFDLNGQFVKDIKLGDLKYKLNGGFFYLNCNKSDLYYFDSECFVFSLV